jgi:glycosyltransferase involved in cell wall biosynthesis
MHILQILHDRERGGIQTLANMIEDGLAPHGIRIETVYLFPRPGLNKAAKLACAAAMAWRILRGQFDALLSYQATASILVGVVGRIRGCKLRIVHQTCSTTAMAPPIRIMDKLVGALGLYSVNIANSIATRAEFEAYPHSYRRSMILIEHGLDAPLPSSGRIETRARFNLPPDRPVLLNVGRLVAQKNQAVLVRALASVPETHLAIAGGGPDDAALRALAGELSLADRLHILGPVTPDYVADLCAASDLFVFPSVWETFGLAAVEAAMLGLPMVVADLPVLREVLKTEAPQPVVFVDPDDVGGWAAAIRAALASAPAVQLPYAREMARKYSRERMIASYLKILQAPLGARASFGLAHAAE